MKTYYGKHIGHETSEFSLTGISNYPLYYHSLVDSRVRYCNTVWGNCGTSLKGQLQLLQDRTARIVTKRDDTNSLLHKLGS